MRKLFTLIASATILISQNSYAENLKLVTGNDYAPFTDESIFNEGLVTDIVRKAYTRAGQDITIEFMPWKRGERQVREGTALATFPYAKTKDRENTYKFSNPLFVVENVPVVAPENANSIESFQDMKGKMGCYPLGWELGVPQLDEMIANGEIEMQNPRSMDSCYRLLDRGRIDFIPADKPTAIIDAKKSLGSLDKVHFEDFVNGQTPLYLMFSKEVSDKKLENFNEYLDSLKETGEYDKIVEKHMK